MPNVFFLVQGFQEGMGSFAGFVETMARAYAAKGCSVTIYCPQLADEPLRETTSYAEIRRFRCTKLRPIALTQGLSFAFQMRRQFRLHPPGPEDIIIANGESALGAKGFAYIHRAPDQPVRVFLRNMSLADEHVPLASRIARWLHFQLLYLVDYLTLTRATAIIYSSMKNRELCMNYYPVAGKPYFIGNKGVTFPKAVPRAALGAGRHLLFVARGDERIRKGIVHLEQALPAIFDEFPDVRLVHLGARTTWNVPERFRSRIMHVEKVPHRALPAYYRACSLLVHCAMNEGVPAVIMEAMAAGCPVVTSDIEGIDEYLTHGKEGLIYRRGDIAALQDAIRFLLRHPGQSRSMAAAAARRIRALENDRFADALMLFIKGVAGGRPVSVNLLERRQRKVARAA